MKRKTKLSKEQINKIVIQELQKAVVEGRLDEGIWDNLQRAASKTAYRRKNYTDFDKMVLENYKQLLREDGMDELLAEGLWSKIKYNVGKVTQWGRGVAKGAGIGRASHHAAFDKLETAMEKAAETGVADFRKNLKKQYPEFPNMEETEDFVKALVEMAALYDSMDKAVEKYKENPKAKGSLDPDSANSVINALREYIEFVIDQELASPYKRMTEEEEEEEPKKRWGKDKEKYTKAGREGEEAGHTQAMKELRSNILPALLGLAGAAGVLAGLLAQSVWFLRLFRTVRNVKSVVTIITKASQLISALDGKGFTHMFGQFGFGNQGHFGANVPAQDLFDYMKTLGPGWDPTNPTNLYTMGVDKATYLKQVATAGPGSTLGDIFPLAEQGLWIDKGADAATEIVTTATKTVTTQVAGLSAAGVAIVAAGPLFTALGISLALAGLGTKLLRMKGEYSSRLQMLNDLYKEMVPLKGGAIVKPPPPGPECPEGEVPDPNDPEKCIPGTTPPGPGPGPGPGTGPDEPYKFPLLRGGRQNKPSIEKITSDFLEDAGVEEDESDMEDFLGKINVWFKAQRGRGADFFDMEDTDYMQLAEEEDDDLQPGSARWKKGVERGKSSLGTGKAADRKAKKRRRYKSKKGGTIAIGKSAGRSQRSISLNTMLKRYMSEDDQEGTPEFFTSLDNRQLRQLRAKIVKFVKKYLEDQGASVQEDVEEEMVYERWNRIAGISKKVL